MRARACLACAPGEPRDGTVCCDGRGRSSVSACLSCVRASVFCEAGNSLSHRLFFNALYRLYRLGPAWTSTSLLPAESPPATLPLSRLAVQIRPGGRVRVRHQTEPIDANQYTFWVYTKDDLLRKKWTLLMSKLRSSHDTRRLLRRSVESRPGALYPSSYIQLSIQLSPAGYICMVYGR